MADTPFEMTHPSIPSSSAETTQVVFDAIWAPKGWVKAALAEAAKTPPLTPKQV